MLVGYVAIVIAAASMAAAYSLEVEDSCNRLSVSDRYLYIDQ